MASENRLIRVDVILKGIETFKRCYAEQEERLTPVIVKAAFSALWMVEKFVKETPTVEVVHGRWIERKEIFYESEGEVDAIGCSECGKSQRKHHRTNYCPNCGAKIDGERKDNG